MFNCCISLSFTIFTSTSHFELIFNAYLMRLMRLKGKDLMSRVYFRSTITPESKTDIFSTRLLFLRLAIIAGLSLLTNRWLCFPIPVMNVSFFPTNNVKRVYC